MWRWDGVGTSPVRWPGKVSARRTGALVKRATRRRGLQSGQGKRFAALEGSHSQGVNGSNSVDTRETREASKAESGNSLLRPRLCPQPDAASVREQRQLRQP